MFQFLSASALCTLSRVCTTLKSYINRPYIWKERYLHLFPPQKREMEGKMKANWKEKYFQLCNIPMYTPEKNFKYDYLMSIYGRGGTGDSWPEKLSWEEGLKKELEKSKLFLNNDVGTYEGCIVLDKTTIGTYRLICPESIKVTFSGKQWYKRLCKYNMLNCRYLSNERGWIAFSLSANLDKSKQETLLRALIRSCRGFFKDLQNDNNATPSLVYYPLWWNYTRDCKRFLSAKLNNKANDLLFQPMTALTNGTSYARHVTRAFFDVYRDSLKLTSDTSLIWQWCFAFGLAKDITKQGSELDNFWSTKLTDAGDRRVRLTMFKWKAHMTKATSSYYYY